MIIQWPLWKKKELPSRSASNVLNRTTSPNSSIHQALPATPKVFCSVMVISPAILTAGLKMYPELLKNDGKDALTLAILPWAHSYGQTGELFAIIRIGGAMGLAESPSTIVNDIVAVKPTWLIAVPRVFNRIYDGLWTKMNKEGGLPKKLFVMGVEAAKKKRELAAEGKFCLMTNLKFKFADKIVFQKNQRTPGRKIDGLDERQRGHES